MSARDSSAHGAPRGQLRGASAREPGLIDVVCFGEVLWDLFERDAPKGAGARREGRTIGHEFRRELGGAPANVASGLARLGVRSAVVGGVGIDRFGEAIESQLRADGVDTRFLVRLPNRTGITFVTRDERGEPSFLAYRHETADTALRAEHVLPEMARARWLLVGSSSMMTPALAEATDRLLALGQEAGARVVVDLNVREHLWGSKAQMRDAIARLVRRASIVKGSFADLVAITGRRDILWLADHAPKAAWIVTQGAKGASALGDHGFVARPSLKAKCVDATGAGDAFVAGVLAVLLAAGAAPGTASWKDERVWSEALEAGHRMGAKAIGRVGAVTGLVDLDEVRAHAKSAEAFARAKPKAPARRGAPSSKKKKAK